MNVFSAMYVNLYAGLNLVGCHVFDWILYGPFEIFRFNDH